MANDPDQAAVETAQVAALESNTTTDHLATERPEYDNTAGAMSALDEAGELVRARFLDFLDQFYIESSTQTQSDDGIQQPQVEFIYRMQALKITGGASVSGDDQHGSSSHYGGGFSSSIVIDHAHLRSYDVELAEALDGEYVRFEPHLRQAAKEFVQSAHAANNLGDDEDAVLPKNQVVFVSVFNLPNVLPVRALRTDQVGRLSSVAGTITRTSDVRPELLSGTFRCESCGLLAENVEQQFQYTSPTICKNPQCSNTSRNKWMLEFDKSVFVDCKFPVRTSFVFDYF